MTCDEARATFSDLYDEVLSGARLVTITQHLASCPACRTEWASFRKAMQAVIDLGAVEPSPGFSARVRQQLETPTRWQRALRWLFFPLHVKVPIQAVAVVLLAFAGLLLYQHSPELRGAIERSQLPSSPTVREAPTPAPPPAGGPVRKGEGLAPSAEAPKAGQAESQTPPMAALAPRPAAPSEPEKGRAPSAQRKEAKDAGKPSGSAKTEESSREFRAKTMESGIPPQALRQAAPAPAEPGGAAAPAPATPKSLAAPPSAPRPSAAPTKEGQISSAPSGPADQLYSSALADLGRQSYDRAIDGLRAFIRQNPRDARVPEARMRLADAYVAQRRYKEAIPEYEALARDFPDSPLIPATLYRQAQARLESGDQTGCQMLRDVSDRYPQTPEAALAREVLSSRCR